MTHVAISIAVADPSELSSALERAASASANGARLVEWRVDELSLQDNALQEIQTLVRESAMPSIVTIRSSHEGGMFDGDEETRAELYSALIASDDPPRYIDVEWRRLQSSESLRVQIVGAIESARATGRDQQTSLIASVHDFKQRPADLMQLIERMTLDHHVDVIKIAWMARSLRDNLEAFDLLSERRKPMIALCMGRFGLISRVLAPKFGGLLTYASDIEDLGTAPGQPTLAQLRDIYHFDSIGPETKVYGVIGWPVEHSRGPEIHNKGFRAIDFDGVYLPLPIPGGPMEYEHFKATVGAMIDHPRLDFRGASVTIPHKENLVRFLKERGGTFDTYSERVGAANTLIIDDDGGLSCKNADMPALIQSLCAGMGIEEEELKDKRIAIFGAGGVARAAVAALSDLRAHVLIYNRSIDKARALVDDLESRQLEQSSGTITIAENKSDGEAERFDAIINCTPIGMTGGPPHAPNESPIDVLAKGTIQLDETVTVMDTVYTPQRTPLIHQAEAAGARTISGVDMFMRQAGLQFELWTGNQLSAQTED